MNIGGLLTRSFGTGTTAFNQGERDALTRMRDRQAFIDEEEARRRSAEMEAVAMGTARKNYTAAIPEMAGLNPDTQAYKGAAAVASMWGAPTTGAAPAGVAPTAGVVPAAAAAAPAGVTVPPAAKTIAQSMQDPEIQKSIIVGYRHNISQVENRINNINAELGKVYASSNDITNIPKKEERKQQLRKELAEAEALRLQLRSGLATEINKSMGVAPAAAPTSAKVGVPSLLAKPDAAASYGDAQFRQLAQAVMQAESGGDPNAVSPKGAVGRMQVMPETLLAPGYGIAPARDNSDAENVRVGTQYLAAMLKEFNGNTQHALAAYNWGPGKTKEWIAKGAKFADLPKETQDYISKITGTPQLGATSAAASNAYVPPVEQAKPADYRNAVPRVDFELRVKSDERAELERQADEAQRRGLPELYTQAVAQLRQLDMELVHLQGMLGLGDIVDNPEATRRLSIVRSHYMGQKEGYYKLMPRSDGKYNEVVNGKTTKQGLSLQEVIDNTRMIFDKSYAAAVNATRAAQSEAGIKLDAKIKELTVEYGLKNAEAMTKAELDRELENIKGAWSYSQAMGVANVPKDKDTTYTKATLDGADVLIASTVDRSQPSGIRSFILTPSVGPNGEPDPTAPPYWRPLQKPPR